MNKKSIFNQIIAQLRNEKEKAEQAREVAQKEANQHVGRMESRYDTFKQEAQYEVASQESRIVGYQNGIDQINALRAEISLAHAAPVIQVGSGVELRSETGEEHLYVLSPAGGGMTITEEDNSIFVLTPDSPLGKQLLGLKAGDPCGRFFVKEIY